MATVTQEDPTCSMVTSTISSACRLPRTVPIKLLLPSFLHLRATCLQSRAALSHTCTSLSQFLCACLWLRQLPLRLSPCRAVCFSCAPPRLRVDYLITRLVGRAMLTLKRTSWRPATSTFYRVPRRTAGTPSAAAH